jgi:putative endonuclease
MDGSWNVYIVECRDKELYVGIAQDVDARIRAYNAGHGCRYTKFRTPVKLLYSEQYADKSSARMREIELKGFSRQKKFAIIAQGSSA